MPTPPTQSADLDERILRASRDVLAESFKLLRDTAHLVSPPYRKGGLKADVPPFATQVEDAHGRAPEREIRLLEKLPRRIDPI